ncbi:ribosomal RNA small subunit methyltransferase h [Plakobranchus ocellatus]|uniref:Ribosomal RNA small subunit methyltransferase h n=1 Tax=Plakobranchus ocellatus TaxID=259542 RepID=A0AAV3XWN1_9GAST|nr:ribosomal RNA small subunit methyltransferase h [Plakobranchus ocellatus]
MVRSRDNGKPNGATRDLCSSGIIPILFLVLNSRGRSWLQELRCEFSGVDKGRGDARNLLAVALNMTEDGLYRLGSDQGTEAGAEFTVFSKELIKVEDAPDHEIAL